MIAAYVKRLRELARLMPRPGCDWEDAPEFDPPATPAAIADLEHTADFQLPSELKAFFAITDRVVGMSVHNGYQIGGIVLLDRLICSGELHCDDVGEPAIPVAFDGGGNWFLLAKDGKVWKVLHEFRRAKVVAASFGEFIERIVADWEAYIGDTPDWKFLV